MLRGLSTGNFAPALTEFFGTDAGLSAWTITHVVRTWSAEYADFEDRDLSDSDYVSVEVDGVHFRIRLENDRLCCLVIVRVCVDGCNELLGCAHGYRVSSESWAEVLQNLGAAQARWRRINSPELGALVRAGAKFKDEIQSERNTNQSLDAA